MNKSEKRRRKDINRSLKTNGAIEEAKSAKKKKKTPPADPLALENFRLSSALCNLLQQKGIKSLFPIQAQSYDLVLDGRDIVARAKTGSGKTLAFVLPIVQHLSQNQISRAQKRIPSVLCLSPTRELARQICSECEHYGKAANLRSFCIYGSSPYYNQEQAIAQGIDLLIGTPGRIKDHLNRGNLDFSKLKFQILDECDQMLQMGFVEDVEFILNCVPSREQIQTLLFSATIPPWVKSLLQKFCKPGYQMIDLMSSEKSLSTDMVQHKCVIAERHLVPEVLTDLVLCHGNGGRIMIFIDTKVECDRITEKLSTSLKAKALHGDLQQKSRELTLDAFRKGHIDVLVATDVAARGLDIPEVDLVIQAAPPKDVESYIHRAGRTGRAERTGICICLVNRSNEFWLRRIQDIGRVKFDWIEAPQMGDMLTIASKKATASIRAVKFHTSEMFKAAAEQMLKECEDPAQLLASALACVAGHSTMQQKSLILKLPQHVTFKLVIDGTFSKPFRMEDVIKTVQGACQDVQVKGIRMLEQEKGAVFEIHETKAQELLSAFHEGSDFRLELITSLPPLRSLAQRPYVGGGRFGVCRGQGFRFQNGRT